MWVGNHGEEGNAYQRILCTPTLVSGGPSLPHNIRSRIEEHHCVCVWGGPPLRASLCVCVWGGGAYHKSAVDSLQDQLFIQSQFFSLPLFDPFLLQFLECVHLPSWLALTSVH